MVIQINGENRELGTLQDSLGLLEILNHFQITSQAIAIAINSEIVPRSEFEKTTVKEGDKVEVIQAVGGG